MTRFLFRAAPIAAAALVMAAFAPQSNAATPRFGAYASSSGYGWEGGEGSFSADRSGSDRYSRGLAAASLANGQLHSFSAGVQLPCNTPGCHGRAGNTSFARYWDTVVFHNGTNLGLAELELSVDGVIAGPRAAASVRWYVGDPKADFFERLNDWAPSKALASGKTVIDDGLVLPLGKRTYFVFAEIFTTATSTTLWDSVADFGNTLHFNWTLPEGVTASSASGVFMTAATPAVPEPETYALMIAGLAAMGFVARRRA